MGISLGRMSVDKTVLPHVNNIFREMVCLGMLYPLLLGVLDLLSQVGTPTFGVGCLFPEGYIKYFWLGLCGDFVSESFESGRLENS